VNWVVGENGWAHFGPFGNEELQSKMQCCWLYYDKSDYCCY